MFDFLDNRSGIEDFATLRAFQARHIFNDYIAVFQLCEIGCGAWLHVVVTIELGLACQEQADELHDKYGLSWEELEELENKIYEEYEEKTRC